MAEIPLTEASTSGYFDLKSSINAVSTASMSTATRSHPPRGGTRVRGGDWPGIYHGPVGWVVRRARTRTGVRARREGPEQGFEPQTNRACPLPPTGWCQAEVGYKLAPRWSGENGF